MGHFRSFRNLKPKFSPRAFARLSRTFRSRFPPHAARYGSYLRFICVSEAEAWTCESSDCPLHPHGTIDTPKRDKSHLCHNDVSTQCCMVQLHGPQTSNEQNPQRRSAVCRIPCSVVGWVGVCPSSDRARACSSSASGRESARGGRIALQRLRVITRMLFVVVVSTSSLDGGGIGMPSGVFCQFSVLISLVIRWSP